MYDTILVATDGSEKTRAAVSHALRIAETYEATVHALYVVDLRALGFSEEEFGDDDAVLDVLTQTGERATGEIEQRARKLGLDATTAVVQGTPARTIRSYAEAHEVDLVALGTRGRSGLTRHVLGSVAQRVLQNVDQPVLTARPTVPQDVDGYDHILLPTDGGTQAERVAAHAYDLAARYDATVHALSVIDTGLVRSPTLLGTLERESEEALASVKRGATERNLDVRTSVWRGTPTDCITRYASERDVDLVTMGTHERRGLDRFLSQTVAERVVRTANCPVLTLRQQSE